MDQDFGKRLEKARIDRGLSLEEAADAVRIRSTFLRALENSDLTKFPNAAYSKSFLLMYGKYLGVNLNAVAREIDTTTQMKVEGYQYLTSRAAELPKSKPDPEPAFSMAPAPRASGSWLPLAVLGGLGFIVVVAGIFWMNINRISDSQPDAPKPGTTRPGDETAIQPISNPPAPASVPARSPAGGSGASQPPQSATPSAPATPQPLAVSLPKNAPAAEAFSTVQNAPESEIPRARAISPVARIAKNDTDALADFPAAKPLVPAPPQEKIGAEESAAPAENPNTVKLESKRKAWVVIRYVPGGQPVYEDFLYPTARPMRLPPGRYFIEIKDADAIEISRNGKRIAYKPPGVAIQ